MEAQVISDNLLYKGRIFNLVKRTFSHQERTFERDVLLHPGAVVILPQDSNGMLLIERQFRPAVGRYILEFPAGTNATNQQLTT